MTLMEQVDSTINITSMETLKARQCIKIGQTTIISQLYQLSRTLETQLSLHYDHQPIVPQAFIPHTIPSTKFKLNDSTPNNLNEILQDLKME